MRSIYLLCGVIIAILVVLTGYYRSEPDTFYGIADTKEIVISSGSPVEIRRIMVAQGQMVKQGDSLLQLHNPELDLKISQISHELNELRTRKTAHATLSKSEIRQFKAEQEAKVGELTAELGELEAQYNLNRQLVSELHSLEKDKAGSKGEADSANPLKIKIQSLKRMLELARDPSRIYVDRLSNAQSSSGDPLIEQVSRMEDELTLLLEEKRQLFIPAQISGLIGSVNFKQGEKVSPFTPILTLHAESPSFVRGYIHEDVYSQVAVGQNVTVHSNHDRKHGVAGVVVGVGARIVEYPERLRKRADILIWGREIIIRLPPQNRFLLGEKVLIALDRHARAAGETPATAVAAAGFAPAAVSPVSGKPVASAPVEASSGKTEVPGIEASGLLFLSDLGKYLVISDDTPKKAPMLFLMDTAMQVEKRILIKGLDAIDDMESITAGSDGSIYIASSQSLNKSGKLPDARKRLIKVRRSGESLELTGNLSLTDLLEKAARLEPKESWAAYTLGAITRGEFDIEGMAWRSGAVLLGCKHPLLDGKAVILEIKDVDSLFAGKSIAKGGISIRNTLDLRDKETGTACGISDLTFVGDDAYLLSTGKAGKGRHIGELWVLKSGAAAPLRIRGFDGDKPEGIALHAPSRSFLIAFDKGSKHPSRMLKIGVVL
jgi:multidrug resistance efflux pump